MSRLCRLAPYLAALLLGLVITSTAHAEVAVPPLTSRVMDLTQTLTVPQRQAIERNLAELEQLKGAQIAVLLVPSTAPETIEQYARRVLDEWKLGRKDIDDGALLLIAKEDRAMRIETQYGLEGVIPDAIGKRIIAEDILSQSQVKPHTLAYAQVGVPKNPATMLGSFCSRCITRSTLALSSCLV